MRSLSRCWAAMMRRVDQNTRVFEQLVKLAGSAAIVESVIEYLNLSLRRAPTADEIASEILKRRDRAERRLAGAEARA